MKRKRQAWGWQPVRTLAGAVAGIALTGCGSMVANTPPAAATPRIAFVPTATIMASATPRPSATPAITASATPEAATGTPMPSASPAPTPAATYTVQRGDTLSGIAARNGVSIAALQLANALGETQSISAGQVLTLPTGKLAEGESTFWFVHIVRAGENLSTIAQRFGVSNEDLIRVNRIENANSVRAGLNVIVPSRTPVTVDRAQATRAAAAVDDDLRLPTRGAISEPLVPIRTAGPVNGPVTQNEPGLPAMQAPSDPGAEAIRSALLTLHNEQRIAAGLAPLQISAALQASAQAHAEDCAARGFGSHTGSDGSTSRQRIARIGFTGRFTGENWAFSRTAERAFEMWFHQESPTGPHRANIMSANYAEVGFGIAPSKGGYYIITNLGGG